MRIASLLVAAAAALSITACGGGGAASGGGSGSSTEPIKLGGWFPLTGPVAASGIPQKQGVVAAFNQVNAEGGINGRKIKFIARDNAFDPQQTIQAARQLVGSDKVVAIVGANGTATTAAAFPYVLNQAKVPIINPYGGAADWYDPAKPLLFGYQTLYEQQAAAVGAWAAQEGAKHIVVVRSDPAAFENVAKNVAPGAKSVDPSVQVDEVVTKFQSTDYSPIVGQVKAKKPDAVVTILAFPEAAAYLKQAKLQGLDVPVYGYGPDADEGLVKLAGPAAEGFHAVAFTKPAEDPSAAMESYRAALKKYAPSEQPSSNSATAYAGAMAFAEVLKKIKGDITPQSISKAMANAGTVDTGMLPPLQWNADKHLGTNELQRVSIKDGKFVAEGDFQAAPKLTAH
jgi:ABC-type branched-subunit amino acid transport system substrate-binding protein